MAKKASRAQRRQARERRQRAEEHGLPIAREVVPNAPGRAMDKGSGRSPRAPQSRGRPVFAKALGAVALLIAVIWGLSQLRR